MKKVHTSNLALRFYKHEGWTKEELDECCSHGEVYCPFPNDERPYWVLDHNKRSCFDSKKLLEKTSEIVRSFPEQYMCSDEQLIEQLN